MTSKPASRRARAITLAPRSCPSRPGLATTTRYRCSTAAHTKRMPPHPTQAEWDRDVRGDNPLEWPDYEPPNTESVVAGRTEHYAFAEGRFDVMGGSMGAAHGEKVVRAYRRATEERLPMVILPASGGARMQEGMVSLIQMARTSSAAVAHARAGLLSLALLRSPTTGGVYASYASLADVRAAEPGATIGFAGPRVVELTTGSPLPPGSHTAESAYEHGLVDAVTPEGGPWVVAALGWREAPSAPSPWPAACRCRSSRSSTRPAPTPARRRRPTASPARSPAPFQRWPSCRRRA